MLQLIEKAHKFLEKSAIISENISYTYQDLLSVSANYASSLLKNKESLNGERVAFMVDPGFEYVAIQWAIWRAGGVAVPLCVSSPLPSLKYNLDDTKASLVVASPTYTEILKPLIEAETFEFITIAELSNSVLQELPEVKLENNAMILYTSGTTNLPKGVVTTHANLVAQISTLVKAWHWTSADHTLCVLPLHHVHGIVNVISCALWSGATVEFINKFSPENVFAAFAKGQINVFMAVPTIYYKLIAFYETESSEIQKEITEILTKFRFMVSGSAALPVSVMEKWKSISNHTLLERWGMTEIGMGISNSYVGERKAGYIGQPLPGMEIKLVNEMNVELEKGQPGEIQVKGPNVFKEYWGKPAETALAFTVDGWFKTGDIAIEEDGYIRILGRESVDIIKSGGYKISSLEIEEVLRKNTGIKDCAVVGIPNEEWGELIVAAIVTHNPDLDLEELNNWMRKNMPSYKTPKKYLIINELPRNTMGKVTKNEIKSFFD